MLLHRMRKSNLRKNLNYTFVTAFAAACLAHLPDPLPLHDLYLFEDASADDRLERADYGRRPIPNLHSLVKIPARILSRSIKTGNCLT